MEFPRFVFKKGGPHECQGGPYQSELVHDQAEHDAALKAGYFANLPDALAGGAAAPAAPAGGGKKAGGAASKEPSDDEPPSRAELEEKAKELGLTFQKNIGDKKLAALVEAAVAKQSEQ